MKASDQPLAKQFIQQLLQLTKIQTISNMQYARMRGYSVDSRIRTQQQPVGTETGRLNSKGQTKGREWWPEQLTNLQNITNPKKFPKLNPLFNVRSIIIPDPGYCFLAADLHASELFAYLAYAGDHEKLTLLHAGQDLHAIIAADILDVHSDDLSYEQRALGKFANFSLGFGGGWRMFLSKVNKDADLTGISIDAKTAKRFVDGWRSINPKTVEWWDWIKAEVRAKGILTNVYGRRRVFLGREDSSGNDWIAFLPQSTMADHLNSSLVSIYERHDPERLQLMLQVHDEILVQVRLGTELQVARVLKAEMEKPLRIHGTLVKIPVEVSVGYKSWGEMEELL